jgi:hypothetical protein
MDHRTVLGSIAIALIGALIVALRHDEAPNPVPLSSPSAAAAASATAIANATFATDVQSAAPRVAIERTLTLRDALTEAPIDGAELAWASGGATTDASGRAQLPAAPITSLSVRTNAAWGSHEYHFGPVEAAAVELVLPVRAGLRITCWPGPFANASGRWTLRPERTHELGNQPGERSRLAWAGAQPALLERLLDDAGAERPATRVERDWQLSGPTVDTWLLYTAHHGAACVGVTGSGFTSSGVTVDTAAPIELRPLHYGVQLVGGQVAVLHVILAASPHIGGRVRYADGSAATNVCVTVASCSGYVSGELVPHDPSVATAAAVSLFRTRGELGFHALLHRSVRTDPDGRFRVPLGATGEVAAWVHERGWQASFVSGSTATPADARDGIELVLHRSSPAARVCLVGPDQRALAGVRVRLLCRSGRFQCHPPVATTDADGHLSLEHCRSGEHYRVHFPDRDFADLDLGAGGRLVCEPAP